MPNFKDIKKDFPTLVNNPGLCYLDNAATSLKPASVIKKINEYYEHYGVNVNRGVYQLSYHATDEYEETRKVVADFINAKEEEIIFTKGASDSLNMVALCYGEQNIHEGDEVIVSELEHHSSILPWKKLCERKGAKLVYVPLNDEGRITVDGFRSVLTDNTKVVALTHVSNVMGYITPIKEIIALAHEKGAIVSVDGAQSTPHMQIDVKDLDCDFFSFSAHKMLGPTGLGILYGKRKILRHMEPLEWGGDMISTVTKDAIEHKTIPYCFETGTPQIAEVIAFKEAINYLKNIGMEAISKHEHELCKMAMDELVKIKGITVYNPTCETSIIAFNINNIHSHDASTIFDQNNVCLRAGNHCAQLIASWLKTYGTLRASFYFYNDEEDVKKFISSVKETVEYFKEW